MAVAAAVDDRPRWARIAHAGAMLEIAALAILWLCCVPVAESIGLLWFPALCALSFIGMWRRVAWGRFLFSGISLLVTFSGAASLIAAFTDASTGLPPMLVRWAIVAGLATLSLLPPVVVGWRRHWFRPAAW